MAIAQFKTGQLDTPVRQDSTGISRGARQTGVRRVVIISNCAPLDWVFIAGLKEHFPDLHVVRTVGSGPAQPETPNTASKKRPRENPLRRLARVHARLHASREVRTVMDRVPNITIDENRLNSSEGEALMQKLAPDMVITCHTGLIKPIIFEQAPVAINIHFGLAPNYRGNNTLFWALFNGEPNNIAITIHRLTAGIDNGNIYGIVRPRMRPWNSETVLAMRMAHDAAEVVARLAAAVDQDGTPPPGAPQTDKGKLYLGRYRTPRKDLEYLFYRRWRYFFRRVGERSLEYFF